eukprot:TRINITY_DN5335_c0_g1_i1.p1 TRINITY_DN5335_c0_g1~~TRINITY_DN5335_c0_g1_i1.p1  ORF type:complete len:1088 (-),score=259.25 TRINITY_DN5335_c0_g1_i1:105-3368(-)
MGSLKERSTPWCTIILVLGTISCNFMVFLGNTWTSDAFHRIGLGTKGWSNVGLGISSSLRSELDEKMNEVSAGLLDALKHIASTQETLDMVLSIAGNETDNAIDNSTELSLLDKHGPERGLALIQEFHGKNASHVANLTPVILTAIVQVVEMVFDKVNSSMIMLMEKLKPALMTVGEWIQKFGEKVTKGLEEFSQTLDKAQKMFDQVMAQLNQDAGKNEAEMVEQTIGLFDASNTGYITAEDLAHVGEWFAISALTGDKPAELLEKYDSDNDGSIDKDDFVKLVNDPSIPGSMSTILRRYAKRLAEIGGNVGRAKMRDEVAKSVSNYIRLVCAKNMTKVGWVSDRLTNDSVPLDFTAVVLVEMCLAASDPNAPIFTLADSGAILVDTMMGMRPQPVLDALDLIANTSWYHSQGLDVSKQPGCLEMVTKWVTTAQINSSVTAEDANKSGNAGLLSLLGVDELETMHSEQHAEILKGLPKTAFVMAEEGVKVFRMERQQAKQKRRNALFGSKTSQMLLARLLGGKAPSDIQGSSAVDEAINSGVPAVPETIEFAIFLMNNATSNANMYMKMAADYAGDSSNPADDFASKINGMVKKVESFIAMMEKYSTPKGIRDLETKIESFLSSALDDVKNVVESRLVELISKTAPQIEDAVHKAAHDAGHRLGAMLGNLLATPLASALGGSVTQALSDGLQSDVVGNMIGDKLSSSLGSALTNLSANAIGDKIGDALDNMLSEGIEKGTEALESVEKKLPGGVNLLETKAHHELSFDLALEREIDLLFNEDRLMGRTPQHHSLALLESSAELESADIGAAVGSAWTGVINMLRSFSNLLPKATEGLKDARAEVTKLASNIDSVFENFATSGQEMFDKIASIWNMIWMIYFVFILPFSLWNLYYGFWANGWFGGPQPLEKDASAPPEGFMAKCNVLCSSCCTWCSAFHDTDLCFWSVIIFMQVIVLLTFIIAVVLAIVAGVKAFLLAGCSMIYVLQDNEVCLGALGTMRNFLDTFQIGGGNSTGPLSQEDINRQCESHTLTTCSAITAIMMKSTIFTVSFGFVGSIFAMQMLFDSATLHEQAVFRRRYNEMQKLKAQ